jgi:hypothetical protein
VRAVVYAEYGDFVYKARDVWRTFWNATLARPASPPRDHLAGWIRAALRKLDDLLKTDPEKVEAAAAMGAKYGVESDRKSTARPAAEHGLIERSY